MAAILPAARRADRFAALLEGKGTPGEAEATLVALVRDLEVAGHDPRFRPTPSARFAGDLRIRLLAAAEHDLRPVEQPTSVRSTPVRRRSRRAGVAVAGGILAASFGGIAVAAQSSLPGQALYPVRTTLESLARDAHPTQAGRGSSYLGQADDRLGDLRKLQRTSGSASTADIAQALRDFQQSSDAGATLLLEHYQAHGDAASLTKLHAFTATSMHQLSALAAQAPPSQRAGYTAAAESLAQIDQQAQRLCPSCGGSTVKVPGNLADGAPLAGLTQLIDPSGVSEPTISTPTLISQHLVVPPSLLRILNGQTSQAGNTGSGSTGGTGGSGGSGGGTPVPTPLPTPVIDDLSKTIAQLTKTLGDTLAKTTDGAGKTVNGVTKGLTDTTNGLLGGN